MLQQACDHQWQRFPEPAKRGVPAAASHIQQQRLRGCVAATNGKPWPPRPKEDGQQGVGDLGFVEPPVVGSLSFLVFTSSSFFTDAQTPNARKSGKPVHLVVAKCILPFRGYRCFDHPTFPGSKQAPGKSQAHSSVVPFSCQALPLPLTPHLGPLSLSLIPTTAPLQALPALSLPL
ncbi:hypothetical protein VTG60DRAFT_5678 [Thermothelomyces hinnuleus]